MVCGPLPMIDAVEHALRQIGVPASHIHSERYEMA
jgi:ferredoxin-NADP reductase